MKAAWAKLSTSIRPKISVSPEAIRNSSMPIASPATVNVTQEWNSMKGSATMISAGSTA